MFCVCNVPNAVNNIFNRPLLMEDWCNTLSPQKEKKDFIKQEQGSVVGTGK